MVAAIASLERSAAALLKAVASVLARMAEMVETEPVSTTADRFLPIFKSGAQIGKSGLLLALTSALGSIIFVFMLTFMFRQWHGGPQLDTVPQPSAIYDPDVDVQADQFCDEDVRPQLVSPSTRPAIQAFNPATGMSLGFVAAHSPDDIPGLVTRARAVQPEWAESSFKRRRTVLRVLTEYILYEQRELCVLSGRDTGKTPLEANLGEIVPTLEKLRWLQAEGEAALRPDHRSVGRMAIHKIATVQYMPLGVLAAIAPWNYPLHNILNPVSAALFAGCAIIVKPSEHAVYSSVHIVRIIRRALAVCGENADLVQCAIGGPDVAVALIKASVDKIFFTGSTAVGRKVAATAAESLIPTCLELGGKDALIVCDDADLNHTLSICLRGIYQNAGQNCIGIERVFLHTDIKKVFIDKAIPIVRKLRAGIDYGALTMGEDAIRKTQELIDDAVMNGAKLLTGGKQAKVSGKGWYYEPTILDGITPAMKIATEEAFAPIMSIFEWKEDTMLIKEVNDSPFGLGSTIFTKNKERGENILKRLRVGMGNINDFAANYLCQSMPFGGTKESGSDKFAGIEGLRGCCIAKAITRDRFSAIPTRIPPALQYPVWDNSFEFAAEINDLLFKNAITSKLDNIRHIVGMMLFRSWRPRTVGSG